MPDPAAAVSAALGVEVLRTRPLSGGCVGEVHRVELADGAQVVCKLDRGADPCLGIEGDMLRLLADRSPLPVPAVLHCQDNLLVMEYVPCAGELSPTGERHAAGLLAALHEVRGEAHGLEQDTLIGGLHQPNPPTGSWVEFFRDQRLRYMAEEAHRAGRMGQATLERVERLAARLHKWLEEPDFPSLLHGDVWGGNVLGDGDRVAAFIDPAVYHGHPEVELAFITMFSTFGTPFFERYRELRGIADGFFETRRDLYNLYPLLVHVRLFGGGYLSSVGRTLDRFGC